MRSVLILDCMLCGRGIKFILIFIDVFWGLGIIGCKIIQDMVYVFEDFVVCGVGGRYRFNSVWLGLFLREEQRSERRIVVWVGEGVVRVEFIEVVIFELDFEK